MKVRIESSEGPISGPRVKRKSRACLPDQRKVKMHAVNANGYIDAEVNEIKILRKDENIYPT